MSYGYRESKKDLNELHKDIKKLIGRSKKSKKTIYSKKRKIPYHKGTIHANQVAFGRWNDFPEVLETSFVTPMEIAKSGAATYNMYFNLNHLGDTLGTENSRPAAWSQFWGTAYMNYMVIDVAIEFQFYTDNGPGIVCIGYPSTSSTIISGANYDLLCQNHAQYLIVNSAHAWERKFKTHVHMKDLYDKTVSDSSLSGGMPTATDTDGSAPTNRAYYQMNFNPLVAGNFTLNIVGYLRHYVRLFGIRPKVPEAAT